MRHPLSSSAAARGFSLVEVTVAIGIFAFVAIGILGLLPAALKLRSDSAQETRAVMIAEELFSSVRSSPGISNVWVRVGPQNTQSDMRYTQNLTNTSVVLGYPVGTTVPYYFFEAPGAAWTNAGAADPEVKKAVSGNDIQTIARLSASSVNGMPNLYQVKVEVRSPAALALRNSKPAEFVTLYYSP